MTKIKIEDLSHEYLIAELVEPNEIYSAYDLFANQAGYPDAVSPYLLNEKFSHLEKEKGRFVRVLAKGSDNEEPLPIYVIEVEDGEHFLIAETGLNHFRREAQNKAL